jgi:hypothetical protein
VFLRVRDAAVGCSCSRVTANISAESPVELKLLVKSQVHAAGFCGPAQGIRLHREGFTVLHGSSLQVGCRGVAILGGARKGKSTLAAILRHRGHLHVSDGMCVLEEQGGCPCLIPGPGIAKLWPDTLRTLGQDPDQFDPILPAHDKRVVPITTAPVTHPIPLTHIFSLDVDPTTDVATVGHLRSVDGMWDLIRNYYLADYIGESEAPQIFARCAKLARVVPVFRLVRPNNLHALDEVAEAVERTVASCP